MGAIITLSGGTGVGKTTIARKLISLQPETFHMVTSVTTREKRETDIEGEYLYTDTYHLHGLYESEKLLWFIKYGDTYYATTTNSVRDALHRPGIGIMIITPDCVSKLCNAIQSPASRLDCVRSYYIESPPLPELKRRLSIDGSRADAMSRMDEERAWHKDAKRSGNFTFVKNEGGRLNEAVHQTLSSLPRFLA